MSTIARVTDREEVAVDRGEEPTRVGPGRRAQLVHAQIWHRRRDEARRCLAAVARASEPERTLGIGLGGGVDLAEELANVGEGLLGRLAERAVADAGDGLDGDVGIGERSGEPACASGR